MLAVEVVVFMAVRSISAVVLNIVNVTPKLYLAIGVGELHLSKAAISQKHTPWLCATWRSLHSCNKAAGFDTAGTVSIVYC